MRKEDGAGKAKRSLPVLAFASQRAWEEWLDEHSATSECLWLKIAKKGSGVEFVSYPETLDIPLCHGWLDGQKTSFDEQSKVNRQKTTELMEQGRMKPAGLKEVERAKRDGR